MHVGVSELARFNKFSFVEHLFYHLPYNYIYPNSHNQSALHHNLHQEGGHNKQSKLSQWWIRFSQLDPILDVDLLDRYKHFFPDLIIIPHGLL